VSNDSTYAWRIPSFPDRIRLQPGAIPASGSKKINEPKITRGNYSRNAGSNHTDKPLITISLLPCHVFTNAY
jgi:hypothetical protein